LDMVLWIVKVLTVRSYGGMSDAKVYSDHGLGLTIPQVSFEDISGESEPKDMPATLLRDGRWLSWNFTEIKPGGGVFIKFRTKVGDNSKTDLIYENEVAATGIIEIGGVEKRATAGNKAFKPK